MPQLNPTPWFFMLIFTWFVLFSLLPTKILTHTFSYDPLMQATRKLNMKAWNWSWQ